MTRGLDDFLYIPNNGQFKYDEELPIVVVGVTNELQGRFVNIVGAEMFLSMALKNYGRIIDTSL